MNEFKKAAEEIIDLFDKKQVKDLQTSIELVKTLLDILVELFDNSDDEEDKQWAVRYAITKLLPLASKMMQSPKVDDNSISKVFDVYKRTYAFCGRRSLVHFIDYMEWDRSSERKVYVNRKEVLDPIIFYLNKIRFDENMEILGISLPPSFGKCVKSDTEILTQNGLIEIKDIKVGDKVFSMENKKIREEVVLNKWETKKKQIKITTKNGKSITVSPDHKMLTFNGYKIASKITEKDYFYSLLTEIDSDFEINEDELIFTTCMIFEGHCKHNRYSYTGEDNLITRRFLQSCENLGITYKEVIKKGSKANSYRLHCDNGLTKNFLEKYNIYNGLAYDKRIPKEFFNMSLKQKHQFLGIMFATDGYFTEFSSGIALANEKLIDDIQLLLSTCGIYSSKGYKFNKQFNKESWVLTIPRKYIFDLIGKTSFYHKKEKMEYIVNKKSIRCTNLVMYPRDIVKNKKPYNGNYDILKMERKTDITLEMFDRWCEYYPELEEEKYKDFYWQKVVSVEYIDELTDMIDIEVSNTHNFIANGYVSHNSFSVNYFTAWLYGVDLNTSVLRLSYNDDLLNGVSRSIKDLVSSDLYSDIFPSFKLYKNKPFDKEKDSDWKLKNSDVQVSHYVRTRDGGTTGVRANTAIILDDMTKGFEEANNDSVHELYWNKYVTEWINRFDGHKVKYIFVGTMWNPKDILNKIKDKEESISPFIDDDKFKYVKKCEDGHAAFITIPLLDDDDKSTCENVMSTQKALQLRDITDPFSWSCVYQQKPIAPTGLEFAYENLNTFKKDDIKEELTSYAFAVLDPTRKGKDNISMPIFNKTLDGETHYMTDVFYKKVAMTDAYDDIIQKIIDDKIIHLFVENNTDTSLKAILDMKLKEKGITYCLIDEKYNTAKKEIRIKDARGLIIKQMRFKTKGEYSPNSDYGRFMSAFTTYSFDYANKNDDAPDSLALYVTQILLNGKQKNTITPLDRSKIGI